MIKKCYMALILTALSIQPLLANQAIQSAPLLAGHYLCLINNASNTDVKIQYIQYKNFKGEIIEGSATTCKKGGDFISLAPGETCFSTHISGKLALPVYCRVQHSGEQGHILGVLQQYPAEGGATTILMPAEYNPNLRMTKKPPIMKNKMAQP